VNPGMANCLTVEDSPQVAAGIFDGLSPAGESSHRVRCQRSINWSEPQFAGALKNVSDEGKRGPSNIKLAGWSLEPKQASSGIILGQGP
jgi:hypothetical protein